ncbi:unnamed protein product, partial [Cylicostephanus goldi]
NIVPICLPPTAYNSTSRAVWIGSNVVISFLVIMVYSTAHVKCHRLSAKNTHEQSVERIRRLLHSLSIVMGIYISTWFVTVLALLVTQILPLGPKVVNEINQQLGWLVIINASMNFFIYLWRAPEYRRVFMYILCLNRDRALKDATITISPASGTSTALRKSSTKNNQDGAFGENALRFLTIPDDEGGNATLRELLKRCTLQSSDCCLSQVTQQHQISLKLYKSKGTIHFNSTRRTPEIVEGYGYARINCLECFLTALP